MVFGILIAHATALYHRHRLQVHFNRFDALSVYPGGKYKRVFIIVVSIGIDTMVHGFPLFIKLVHVLQYLNYYLSVSQFKAEKRGFLPDILFFVFFYFFPNAYARAPIVLLPTRYACAPVHAPI